MEGLLSMGPTPSIFFSTSVGAIWARVSLLLLLASEALWYNSGDSLQVGYDFGSAEVQSNPYTNSAKSP